MTSLFPASVVHYETVAAMAQSFAAREEFEQIGRFLGGQAGHLSLGHQRFRRWTQPLDFLRRQEDFLILPVSQHHASLISLRQQPSYHAAIDGARCVG